MGFAGIGPRREMKVHRYDQQPSDVEEAGAGALDGAGSLRAEDLPKDKAIGCSGCQDLGYCRRGLDQERLASGCTAGAL